MVSISAWPQAGQVSNDSRQSSVMCLSYVLHNTPRNCVLGAMVMNMAPYFLTFS